MDALRARSDSPSLEGVAERVDWSEAENDSVVLAYLDMLGRELRHEPYVKTETNRRVQEATGRSRGSVEFKFANVSAVLNEMHHPYIRGYQPRSNFQDSLRDAVLRHVHAVPDLAESALQVVTEPGMPRAAIDWRFAEVPDLTLSEDYAHHRRAAKRDYVAIDAANRSLGHAGEVAVVSLEKQRLRARGSRTSLVPSSTSARRAATGWASTSSRSRRRARSASSRSRRPGSGSAGRWSSRGTRWT